MLKIVRLPLVEKAYFSLSPPYRAIRHCGNMLPELDFKVEVTSFVERPSEIIFNGENILVSWTKNPRAYHQIFEQVDYLTDRKNDYYGAQRKLYYLLKDSLSKANRANGVNGYILVRAFLELSKVFQKQEQWENAIDAARLASNLDPFSNKANLAVAFLCADHGDSFEGYRFSEEAVFIDPQSLAARKSLVGLASREELYTIASQHSKLEVAIQALNENPFLASSYINLAGAYLHEGDFNEALRVLNEGSEKLDHTEKGVLERYLEELNWRVAA